MGLLSLAIWLPIAFGVLLLALGRDDNARPVRALALIGALLSLLATLPLITGGSSASTCTTTSAWTACRCGSCRSPPSSPWS